MPRDIILKPGDSFPAGQYLYGWRLNDDWYPSENMYVVYEPERKAEDDEPDV